MIARTPPRVMPLQTGDRLSREQFRERYEQHPEIKKAELIGGTVLVASPVSADHSEAHALLIWWAGNYRLLHPEVEVHGDVTLRLQGDDEVQPDLCLLLPASGRTGLTSDRYFHGAPELIGEVAATSASYDLHTKKNLYRRNGVQEYIVWRVYDRAIDWFELRDAKYERLEPDASGMIESRIFPGLRLAVPQMLAGDLAAVLDRQRG